MKWPTLSHRAVEVLRELARDNTYQPPAAGPGDDIAFARLMPQRFAGAYLDRPTKLLLSRLGYVTVGEAGQVRIAEAGRDYLFALTVGDAPEPLPAPAAREARKRQRRASA